MSGHRIRVPATVVISTLVLGAAITAAWLHFDGNQSPESEASILADYQRSAQRTAEMQQRDTLQAPARSQIARPAAATSETISQTGANRAYFCGSAETGLHPTWNTRSVVYYCTTHRDVPEPAAARYGRHPPRTRVQIMHLCMQSDVERNPGDSHALAEHKCDEMFKGSTLK